MGEIIRSIKTYFVIRGGIGVELHPEDVHEENLLKLKAAGVTMISIGVQSFQEDCLTAIGRNSFDKDRLFSAINKVRFETVDMDLIFAIPGQTCESLKKDIEIAFSNGATQISAYPFIDFTFANNRYKPLPEREKKRMLKEMANYCAQKGYQRTSVWTFAKPNSGKYSSITRDNFIGFGVSATTLLERQFKINTFSIEGYIERVEREQLPTALTLDFSPYQRMVYYLFWSAYSMRVHSDRFMAFFDRSLSSVYGFELLAARLLGFVKKRGQDYMLTERGAYYYHFIEQAYTTAYIDKMWHISRNEPFPDKIILK